MQSTSTARLALAAVAVHQAIAVAAIGVACAVAWRAPDASAQSFPPVVQSPQDGDIIVIPGASGEVPVRVDAPFGATGGTVLLGLEAPVSGVSLEDVQYAVPGEPDVEATASVTVQAPEVSARVVDGVELPGSDVLELAEGEEWFERWGVTDLTLSSMPSSGYQAYERTECAWLGSPTVLVTGDSTGGAYAHLWRGTPPEGAVCEVRAAYYRAELGQWVARAVELRAVEVAAMDGQPDMGAGGDMDVTPAPTDMGGQGDMAGPMEPELIDLSEGCGCDEDDGGQPAPALLFALGLGAMRLRRGVRR